MITIKRGGKLWGLEHNDEPIRLRLVRNLNRDNWGLEDIHEVAQMIEREPIVKEAVCDLLVKLESKPLN